MDQAKVITHGEFVHIIAEQGDNVIAILPEHITGIRTSDSNAFVVYIDTWNGSVLDFKTLNRALVIDVVLATIEFLQEED